MQEIFLPLFYFDQNDSFSLKIVIILTIFPCLRLSFAGFPAFSPPLSPAASPPSPLPILPAPAFQCGIHSAAPNVNDARKALREQACPGIGCLRVAPRLL